MTSFGIHFIHRQKETFPAVEHSNFKYHACFTFRHQHARQFHTEQRAAHWGAGRRRDRTWPDPTGPTTADHDRPADATTGVRARAQSLWALAETWGRRKSRTIQRETASPAAHRQIPTPGGVVTADSTPLLW